MTNEQKKIIKARVGVLELAKQLGNVSHACKVMGYSRDTFYRYLPLIRYENQPGLNLPLRKLIYTMRGAMDHAEPRRPYPPLDEVTLRELDALLVHLGLTVPGPVTIDASR